MFPNKRVGAVFIAVALLCFSYGYRFTVWFDPLGAMFLYIGIYFVFMYEEETE